MRKEYEEDRQTITMPGTDGAVAGTAVNDWVDDEDKGKSKRPQRKATSSTARPRNSKKLTRRFEPRQLPSRLELRRDPLEQIAPAFIEMAHSIVWASVATVDENGRPRSRILHPIWEWDGTDLFGWVATVPSPVKKAHLAVHPEMSVSYWTTTHDTCSAECLVEWYPDDETRAAVWDKFANGPEPVGYDPRIIPMWADGPTSDQFAALRLSPTGCG